MLACRYRDELAEAARTKDEANTHLDGLLQVLSHAVTDIQATATEADTNIRQALGSSPTTTSNQSLAEAATLET